MVLFLVIPLIIVLLSSCSKKEKSVSSEDSVVISPVIEKTGEQTESVDDEIFSPSPVVNESMAEITETSFSVEESVCHEEEITPVPTENDKVVYEGVFSYRGIESSLTVGTMTASLTVPDGVSEEDIASFASLILRSYPDESSSVTYELREGKLVLTYPSVSDEYLIDAIETFEREAEAYIDSLFAENEEYDETSSSEESPIYSDDVGYKSITSRIEIYSSHAVFTIPEGMTAEDIHYYAEFFNSKYPEEAALVTYTVEDGVLTLYYPEQDSDYLLSALDVLLDDAVRIIDSIADGNEALFDKQPEDDERNASKAVESLAGGDHTGAEISNQNLSLSESCSQKAAAVERSVRGFSIAPYVGGKYNPSLSESGLSAFNFAIGMKFEAGLNPYLALGLFLQYDFSSFVEAGTFLKWTFAEPAGVELFATVGFGGLFKNDESVNGNSVLVRLGLGCEHYLTSSFALYGEALFDWSKTTGFGGAVEIGARYLF